MKKLLKPTFVFLCMCGGLTLTGCHKERPEAEVAKSDIVFTISGGSDDATRATAPVAESDVNEWCLYIADADGVICDAVSTSSLSVTRTLPNGSYTVYAAVNCGLEPGSVSGVADILSHERRLEDEGDGLSMFGATDFFVSDGAYCAIPVRRLVSKVVIRKMSVDFSKSPDIAAKSFSLDAVYLINVCGGSVLQDGWSFVPQSWYDRRERQAGAADALIHDSVGVTMTSGQSHDVQHVFYAYQNNTVADSRAETWSPRHTRLVVECTLGGEKTYYPIDIVGSDGRLARNSLYTVNELVVTGYGSTHPDLPVVGPLPYRLSAAVMDWEGTHIIEEIF